LLFSVVGMLLLYAIERLLRLSAGVDIHLVSREDDKDEDE